MSYSILISLKIFSDIFFSNLKKENNTKVIIKYLKKNLMITGFV